MIAMGNQCNQCREYDSKGGSVGIEYDTLAEDPVRSQDLVNVKILQQERQRASPELPRLRLGSLEGCHEDPLKLTTSAGSASPMKRSSFRFTGTEANGPSAPCMEVAFEDQEGHERKVEIFKRPLGADFTKLPFGPTKISVVKPQSYAWSMGLEVGWIIKTVNGADMTKKTFEETQAAMKACMEKLPLR